MQARDIDENNFCSQVVYFETAHVGSAFVELHFVLRIPNFTLGILGFFLVVL